MKSTCPLHELRSRRRQTVATFWRTQPRGLHRLLVAMRVREQVEASKESAAGRARLSQRAGHGLCSKSGALGHTRPTTRWRVQPHELGQWLFVLLLGFAVSTSTLAAAAGPNILLILALVAAFGAPLRAAESKPPATAAKDISRAALLDRIHGGWAGMLIGGLEGLPHEFKYREQPRDSLPDFTFLPNGARSDDDNDFEWPHLWFMDKEGVIRLPYPRIVEIWKANMNQGIWVANKQARKLMDEGVVPPETGSVARNPHAWYNLSGQFCVESYGLIAPGMPQTAADIGLHYARVAVSEEPLQATQFWTSLISLLAFHEGTLAEAMRQALAAVDPRSCMAETVQDAQQAFRDHPTDWKAARQALHEKWRKQRKWNDNSTPVNGLAVVLALLYGQDDFYRTLQYAMALGYDADCNAATAGAVVGCRLGFRHIAALPQFRMPDRYVNKTRPSLPAESKVSEQAETLLRVCERVILANGGQRITIGGKPGFRVKLQPPRVLERLPDKPHGPDNLPPKSEVLK